MYVTIPKKLSSTTKNKKCSSSKIAENCHRLIWKSTWRRNILCGPQKTLACAISTSHALLGYLLTANHSVVTWKKIQKVRIFWSKDHPFSQTQAKSEHICIVMPPGKTSNSAFRGDYESRTEHAWKTARIRQYRCVKHDDCPHFSA